MGKRFWLLGLRCLLPLTLLFGLSSKSEGEDVRRLAARVDSFYNSLRTLQAEFAENYNGAGMSKSESGTLWLKRPGQMRWEYRQPREKLFLTDGKTAWFYVPSERQARKASLKKIDDLRTPLAYLLGRTRLEKEFDGLSLAPDVKPENANGIVLRGIPNKMTDRFTQVLLEITPEGHIVRIVADEVDGSSTEFRFRNLKENVPIPSERFKFKPPLGVETVEARELEP